MTYLTLCLGLLMMFFIKFMQTEFINLSLSKNQAMECLSALLLKSALEDELRNERGQEPAEPDPLILRLATLLNIKEKAMESQLDLAEEALWEYSWFVFTNEWAWFRARQEAKKAAGQASVKETELDKQAEKIFKMKFDDFVKELDMDSQSQKSRKNKNVEQRKGAGGQLGPGA